MKNKEEKNESDLLKENEKEEGKSFSNKGGLYSKIPKNEKSIKGATILVILFGLTFIGLVILGIVVKC